MNEIKLNMRYPESRLEDVTDAYTRGFEVGRAMMMAENDKLRELVRDVYRYTYVNYCDPCLDEDGASLIKRMRELGVRV